MMDKIMELISSKHAKILAVILCVILLIGLVCCSGPDEQPEEYVTGTVAFENLAVYKKASVDSKVLSQLPMNLEIGILEQTTVDEKNWGRIGEMTLPDGTKVKGGWVDLQYVSFGGVPDPTDPTDEIIKETEPEAPPVTVNMGTVVTGELNIRKGADSGYEAVGTYLDGARIEILETKTVDNVVWGRTNLGWVSMNFVRMDGTVTTDQDSDSTAAKVISDGNSKVLGYGVVNLGELNVRLGPGTQYTKIGTVTMPNRYAYYQLADGWVRIESGWVSTDYFYVEGTVADGAMTGAVTTDDLNIRTGPNKSFQTVGTYNKGDIIEILAQVDAWGYTEKGWVFITYIEAVEPTYTTGTGKVTIGLNIRKEPNAEAEIAGTYTEGETVTVTEVQGSWGKTDKGWINLKYVNYD